jgi:hypothetical protein
MINFYDQIIALICRGEGFLYPHLLFTRTRKGEVMYITQLSMYFAKEYKLGSWEWIAAKFKKDHATAMHAYDVILNYLATDKVKASKIEFYRKTFENLYKVNGRSEELYSEFTVKMDDAKSQINKINEDFNSEIHNRI